MGNWNLTFYKNICSVWKEVTSYNLWLMIVLLYIFKVEHLCILVFHSNVIQWALNIHQLPNPSFNSIISVLFVGSHICCHVATCLTSHVCHFLSLFNIILPGALPVRGSWMSSLMILCLTLFLQQPLPLSAKSNEKAKKPGAVPTLWIKLKIIADVEGGKWSVSIRHEHGIPHTTIRTI